MVKKMNFVREIKKVDDNVITIELPLDYKNKEVEILVLPVEGFQAGKSGKSVKRRSFESLKYISIDTRAYKFNREELHER